MPVVALDVVAEDRSPPGAASGQNQRKRSSSAPCASSRTRQWSLSRRSTPSSSGQRGKDGAPCQRMSARRARSWAERGMKRLAR